MKHPTVAMIKNAALVVGSAFMFCNSATSQALPPILQVDKPQRGIYLDFKEFLNNSPSINAVFELKPRSKSKQYWLGGSDYDLIMKDARGYNMPVRDFWGVSTGDSIYVNVANYQYNKGYIKFQKLGRYCYLKGQNSVNTQNPVTYVPTAGAVGGLIGSIPHEAAYVLNINNGNFYMLHKTIMMKILEKDAELLEAYTAEKNQDDPDTMLPYVEKYNVRHPEEIGTKEKIAQVIIYRREKKERLDTVTVLTADSLRLEVGTSDFRVLYAKGKSIALCVNNECKDYELAFDEINYIECSFSRNENKPNLESKEKKVGEFYLREIQYDIEKRKE